MKYEQIVDSVARLPFGKEFIGLEYVIDPYACLQDDMVWVSSKGNRFVDSLTTVGDVCCLYYTRKNVPCFIIRGRYTPRFFTVDSSGSHLLCFSGRPLCDERENAEKYKMRNALFRFCWKDNKVGYMTEVIEVNDLGMETIALE